MNYSQPYASSNWPYNRAGTYLTNRIDSIILSPNVQNMNDITKQKCKNYFFLGKTLLSESIAEFRKLHQARPRGDFRLTTLSSRLCVLAGSNAGITRFEMYIDGHKKFLFLHSSRFKAHISYFLLARSHACVRSVKQTCQGVGT